MLLLQNSRVVKILKLPVVVLCALFCITCGFMDLRPIEISTDPDKNDTLLPCPDTPVILSFDTEVNKNEAEGIMQITSDSGLVHGDRFWKGNNLYFVPAAGWTAGVRYTLSLAGIIRSIDGRELRVEQYVSFYAINRERPPLLIWNYPANGASTGTEDVILEFHFSSPMERILVEASLIIDGIGNKSFEWSDNDTILRVIPDKPFAPWMFYHWTIKENAKSRDGVPVPKIFSGCFCTDRDKILPCVMEVFPVLNTDGIWYPTGASIEAGLAKGNGIAVEFNKIMGENVLRSLRIEPALSGRIEQLSEKSIVYIFTKDPENNIVYTLIVSGDTRDSEGLKIGEDYKINFSPDIPFLNILSVKFDDNTVIDNFSSSNNLFAVKPNPATGELYITFYFSMPFSTEEKKNSALKILLNPFFPRNLPSAALQYVHWISDDRLRMGWEDLKAGNNDENHYYKLTIPGGKGGIISDTGIYMKEDISIYLEALK